ncbi:hypothetical protein [Paractinoplanes brasiliensis]|uniref:Uncharacterized protein n=1 Tax=Paractinoplanes brasiliensis TaxID=52695 RepID=A0A4R6JR48_9ACTN|nr:hypothetical protein [Actinoplanes brasiliensis]TDO39010.1 hypothetical protein C8E87_2682 [Actinoplanes brasiliensis]
MLGPGEFDVVARPRTELAYRPDLGWRATPDGVPVCVHPFRVGMAPGAYASAGTPLPPLETDDAELAPPPEALVLPELLDDLSGWMVAHLRVADRDEMFSVVARLERQAGERFAPGEVVAVLRRVLSVELARS